MRRIASVLAARRDRTGGPSATSSNEDSLPQRESQKPKTSVFNSLSRKVVQPTLPSLVSGELTNSSSSSSCGSTTLRTPDDDTPPRTPSKRGNWKSWLGAKKTADHVDEMQPHTPPKTGSHQLKVDPANESEDDESYHSPALSYGTSSSEKIASARMNLGMLITNSLIPHPTSPPLLESDETMSFPRSSHLTRRLPHQETMESELHRKMLLMRLDRLSHSEEFSIAPFASKVVLATRKASRDPQLDFFPDAGSVAMRSKGLRNWVARPCYEDRAHIWTRQETGDITCTRVLGPSFGVAALEFSEPLELLAGTLLENDDDAFLDVGFDPASELFDLSAPESRLDPHVAPTVQLRAVEPLSLNPGPPLRDVQIKEPHSYPNDSSLPSSPPTQSDPPPPVAKTAADEPVLKRGVRFADDGKDDQIPLGYVLRIKKNKEKKANFLRQERERRAMTLERMMREEERRRQEVERQEMAKLQRARELERKRAEEERRRRVYAEELNATRARREAARVGHRSPPASHTGDSARDRSASRDSAYASPRRTNSSQRFAPELIVPTPPYNASPISSLPATPGSQHSFSRPPSIYSAHTASSDDVRGRDGRRISKRSSTIADPTKQIFLQAPSSPRASFVPYTSPWTGLPPVPTMASIPPGCSPSAVPLVNTMPFYGMDMPLLPPSPPFMNQYGRPRSFNSSQALSLPRTRSSEVVPDGSRSPRSHSNPTHSGHHRRTSDESGRTTISQTASRSDSYGNPRTTPSGRTRLAHSQSGLQRSSWVSPDDSPTHPSSSVYQISVSRAHQPTPTRRRTAMS